MEILRSTVVETGERHSFLPPEHLEVAIDFLLDAFEETPYHDLATEAALQRATQLADEAAALHIRQIIDDLGHSMDRLHRAKSRRETAS